MIAIGLLLVRMLCDLSFRKSHPAWESHRRIESPHDRGRCLRSCIRSECSPSTCLSRHAGVGGIVFIALDVRFHLLRRHQPHLMAKPAQPAAAQKGYILPKKPSLSGTLCAKPPPRACSIPVRASQSILRAVVSDARTSDFKHAPVGGYGETQPPSRADDAVGPGWNGLQQASDRAR